MTLVIGPPSRLPYVKQTMLHLRQKGFPQIRWLRTPGADELKQQDPEGKPEKRLLIIYYTTLFPAVKDICARHNCSGVFVMEDTCIVIPGIEYNDVRVDVATCRAGVFGYGDRVLDKGDEGWNGTKGFYMTPEWCEEMTTILRNTHLRHFLHADMWLKQLKRHGKDESFELLRPLAGYGHRISMTISRTDKPRWGWGMAASLSW